MSSGSNKLNTSTRIANARSASRINAEKSTNLDDSRTNLSQKASSRLFTPRRPKSQLGKKKDPAHKSEKNVVNQMNYNYSCRVSNNVSRLNEKNPVFDKFNPNKSQRTTPKQDELNQASILSHRLPQQKEEIKKSSLNHSMHTPVDDTTKGIKEYLQQIIKKQLQTLHSKLKESTTEQLN